MDSITVAILSIFLLFNLNSVSSDGTIDKRRPGWGKRDSQNLEDSENGFFDEDKRRPGWGKRTAQDYLIDELDKRKPGWGKRSNSYSPLQILKRRPGWGKRETGDDIDKRKPGWGKRSESDIQLERRVPGWGKRDSYLPENELQAFMNKRKPGWGKRSDDIDTRRPGWGKRVPGWGKRSSDTCELLAEESNRYINLAIKTEVQRMIECGITQYD